MYNNCTFYAGQYRDMILVHDKVDDIKLCLHNKIMSVINDKIHLTRPFAF